MDRKHDLDTDEIYSEKLSDKSKITPRLRDEFVGVIVSRIKEYPSFRNFGKLLRKTIKQEFRYRLIEREEV